MVHRPEPLPPLQNLRAFESAARLASFTRAARELNVTQGAVSRQIRHLEERLGFALFERADRGVRLTPAGERFALVVGDALQRIAAVTADLGLAEGRGPITIGATTALASLWLMPQLTGFRRAEPDLEIRVLASDHGFDRRRDRLDLMITYDRQRPPGERVQHLFDETVFPVCSPDYLGGRPPPGAPERLLDETLLVLDDEHPDWIGWDTWLARADRRLGDARRSIRVNSYPMLLQAAVAGQGIALGWGRLVDDFIAAGTLVRLPGMRMTTHGAFHLTTLRPVPDTSPVARLRDWLAAAAAGAVPGTGS